MSSDFNKSSLYHTSSEENAEAQSLEAQRITAEEAERLFMSFVEKEYTDGLRWIFAEIRRKAASGNDMIRFPIDGDPSAGVLHTAGPGLGSRDSVQWRRVQTYLGKLGYAVSSDANAHYATVGWSSSRRPHP